MAYDEGLAERIRHVLEGEPTSEKKMFGGIAFLLNGNMSCGVIDGDLIVRAGKDAYEDLLDEPHTREFDFTGRPMSGWVVVEPEGTEHDEGLREWVGRGLSFAKTLPSK